MFADSSLQNFPCKLEISYFILEVLKSESSQHRIVFRKSKSGCGSSHWKGMGSSQNLGSVAVLNISLNFNMIVFFIQFIDSSYLLLVQRGWMAHAVFRAEIEQVGGLLGEGMPCPPRGGERMPQPGMAGGLTTSLMGFCWKLEGTFLDSLEVSEGLLGAGEASPACRRHPFKRKKNPGYLYIALSSLEIKNS